MLSYKHAFHAGNHADVIKHIGWIAVIDYLCKKNKPFTLFDTHAGAGQYSLDDDQASKNCEYESGIARLVDTAATDPLIEKYLALCGEFYQQRHYPGSPVIAASLLRDNDQLHVMELHPGEIPKLQASVKRLARGQVHIHHRDGLEGLNALAPPSPVRGAALIDPPYELLSEYQSVTNTVSATLKKWAQAQIVIWYPLLSARAGQKSGCSERMVEKLAECGKTAFTAELHVADKAMDTGMYGSGLLFINPSWQLDTQLENALNTIAPTLGSDINVSVTWRKREST
ncbi:23S rRNA (adenine(2030)-N(6))-methyltransferase RlmJ [Alteromonas sp. H39]|uniref:23S rRNA (adenine(2030)-N(6))-methyltransferase RlmJ n=1 Tax=Alteromonas sp. H39 TaxID=3389876 RepID=UPI0039DFB6FF